LAIATCRLRDFTLTVGAAESGRQYALRVLAWHGAVWGAVGGAVVEAYDTVALVRATGRWPWLDPEIPAGAVSAATRWNAFGLWVFSTLVRVAAGSGTAAAASGQISGELGAFGLGVAGPLALERILSVFLPRPESAGASGGGSSAPQQPTPSASLRACW
jgi:hypothetical protein